MSGRKTKRSGFRFVDILVIIIFLGIAAFFVNLFRLDLLQTINLQNVEPVGIVVIKKNTVQRRLSDRVLWDRLANESPVYIGDLIRVADLSSAALIIEGSNIDLDENTLIRIEMAPDGESFQIVLSEGSISLVSSEESRDIFLDIGGRQVQVNRGTVMNAASGIEGISIQVNEGAVRFFGEEGPREIVSGSLVSISADGTERNAGAAAVLAPSANARFIKNSSEPVPVDFLWNRINLAADEALRLEIAQDGAFNRIVASVEGLDRQTRIFLDAGTWYWRLSLESEETQPVLSKGRIIVADGTGPLLRSPAANSLFRYSENLPVINFQWDEAEEAISYIFETSTNPDFSDPLIRINSSSAFLSTYLGPGIWYWRVLPVFPSVFGGSAAYSSISFFRIERGEAETAETDLMEWLAAEAPSLILPADVPADLLPVHFTPPLPPQVILISPVNGAVFSGLTALREQIVFNWSIDQEYASSRFVLSSNPDPLNAAGATVISNSESAVSIERLAAGTWYWTVEIQTADGSVYSAEEPQRFVVQPVPLLPSPQIVAPARGTSFGFAELQTNRIINFSWTAVPGANAYIFTLYQQTGTTRRQIVRTNPISATSYRFDNFTLLDRGTFVWQVEAVNVGRTNLIDQRGNILESSIILAFPSPGPVQINETGILYGN